MRFIKIIGFIFLISFLSLQNLSAQSVKKTTTIKKPPTEVKTVPSLNKTAIKSVTKQASAIQKQQIKKAVRRTSLTKRPIRKR